MAEVIGDRLPRVLFGDELPIEKHADGSAMRMNRKTGSSGSCADSDVAGVLSLDSGAMP